MKDPYSSEQLTHWKSELNWDLDTVWMIVLSDKIQFSSHFFIDAACGIGIIQSGTCTDTDWLSDRTIPWIKTKSPSHGNFYFSNFDANLRVLGTGFNPNSLDIFAGLGIICINVAFTDPVSLIYYEWIHKENDINPGMNSSYHIVFAGPRLGIKEEIRLFSFLKLKTSVTYLPILYDLGIGFWNLRNLKFVQHGQSDGLEYNFSIGINPAENLSFELGYTNQIFELIKSKDWDSCRIKQSGFSITGIYKF